LVWRPAAHPGHHPCQLGLGQVRDPAELLCRLALVERVQHVRLRPADALGQERGDVAVTTVLAEQVGPVPETRHRL
jgi:hypothetical protein